MTNFSVGWFPEVMGHLVEVLGREQDLLQRVLLLLHPQDLHSLELTCSQVRLFMARSQTWRWKLLQDFAVGQGRVGEGVLEQLLEERDEAAVSLHVTYKDRYREEVEAAALVKWTKFCRSWMTIMTISSLYSFLHPEEEEEPEPHFLEIPLLTD